MTQIMLSRGFPAFLGIKTMAEYNSKFRSFCITVRPKNGLHVEYAQAVEKYIRKQKHYVYTYEKEAEARHLHAQIFFEDAVRKSNIQTALKRIAEKHDENWNAASRKVLVSGVKIAYNDNFMDNYITKEGGTIGMEAYNPPDNTEEFYPTLEEQAAVQATANATDRQFHKLKELWDTHYPDYTQHQKTLKDVGLFIYDLMFEEKVIPVITDDRRRKQLVKALTHYIFPYGQSAIHFMFTHEDICAFNNIQEYDL